MSYKEIDEIRPESIFSIWFESKFPFIGNGEDFSVLIKKLELQEIDKGWVKNTGNFSKLNKTQEGEDRYKELFKWVERINNVSLEHFKKTVMMAKENNINVIFIIYPVSKEFNDALIKQNLTREEHYNIIFEKVDEILNESYFVLDYYEIFFDKPDYFDDSDHLNYIGAEIFSKQIYIDLSKLNLTNFEINNKIPLEKKELSGNGFNLKNNRNRLLILHSILILSELFLLFFLIILEKNLKK